MKNNQTGSGKSFTLEGNSQSMNGLIPLAVRNMYSLLREKIKGIFLFILPEKPFKVF